MFGIVFFGIFARGEVQDWAREEVDEEEGQEEKKDTPPEEMKMLNGKEAASNGHAVV